MSYIENGSFKFGNIDMYDEYGIVLLDDAIPGDLFLPSIRSRKVNVPNRHGEYDFGAKYYNERELVLRCITKNPPDKSQLRSYVREMAYALSKKSEIRIWHEPDKYYLGRIYSDVELTLYRAQASSFELTFTCDPFVYGNLLQYEFVNNSFKPNYKGTFSTPTRIEIINTGDVPIEGITIIQSNRKENY